MISIILLLLLLFFACFLLRHRIAVRFEKAIEELVMMFVTLAVLGVLYFVFFE